MGASCAPVSGTPASRTQHTARRCVAQLVLNDCADASLARPTLPNTMHGGDDELDGEIPTRGTRVPVSKCDRSSIGNGSVGSRSPSGSRTRTRATASGAARIGPSCPSCSRRRTYGRTAVGATDPRDEACNAASARNTLLRMRRVVSVVLLFGAVVLAGCAGDGSVVLPHDSGPRRARVRRARRSVNGPRHWSVCRVRSWRVTRTACTGAQHRRPRRVDPGRNDDVPLIPEDKGDLGAAAIDRIAAGALLRAVRVAGGSATSPGLNWCGLARPSFTSCPNDCEWPPGPLGPLPSRKERQELSKTWLAARPRPDDHAATIGMDQPRTVACWGSGSSGAVGLVRSRPALAVRLRRREHGADRA